MTPAFKIIQHAHVVAWDDPRLVFRADILVKDDRIAEISNRGNILKSLYPSAEVIDATGKIALPGFVDAHYHGDSFLLRQLTDSSEQGSRLIQNVLQHLSKDDLLVLYRAAYFSALKSGITTIAEFAFDGPEHSYHAIAESLRRADVRGLIGLHNGDQIEAARVLPGRGIRHAVVLPSDDTLTTYNLQVTLRMAQAFHWPIAIHRDAKRGSEDLIKRNFGKAFISLMQEYKVLDHPVQLIHCSSLDETDAATLGRRHLPLILSPASILTRSTESPNLELLLRHHVPFALGSDCGAADPFGTMRALRVAATVSALQPDGITLLKAHTSGAARALGMENDVGTIQPGMKADIVFLDAMDIRLTPISHPDPRMFLEELVLLASSRDVSDVMVNGEFFVRQREIMTYAEEDLRRDVEALRSRLSQGFPWKEQGRAQILARPEESRERTRYDADPVGEEGFRIVRRASSDDAAWILSLPPQERSVELPKSAKRVFGEDEEN